MPIFSSSTEFCSAIRLVDVDLIDIPESTYQRSPESTHSKKDEYLAENWDWGLYDPIKVYPVGGRYETYEGGRRTRAARTRKIKHLPAVVYPFTDQEAVKLFKNQGRARIDITRFNQYYAALYDGDPIAKGIQEVLKRHQYEATPRGGRNSHDISAIASLYKVVEGQDVGHLDYTLGVIREIWKEDRYASDGAFITGMGIFLGAYGSHLTDEAKRRLAEKPIANILATAKGHQQSTRSTRVAAALRETSKLRKLRKIDF